MGRKENDFGNPLSRSSTGRYEQITSWLVETSFSFFNTTKNIIQVQGIEKGFIYFLNNMPTTFDSGLIGDNTLSYLLEKNFKYYGKKAVVSKLFKLLFGKRISAKLKKKSIKVTSNSRNKLADEIDKFEKTIQVKGQTIIVDFMRRKNGTFVKRGRNPNTGKFIKLPKEK